MSLEEKVGITVTLLLLLLVVGIFLTRDFAIKRNRVSYEVVFEGPVNLKKGDPVAVLGVSMGKISDIRIENNNVVVKFYTEKFMLKEDSRIIMESSGILGQVRLLIIPGEGKEAHAGTRFQGERTKSLDDLIAEFLTFTDTLTIFLKRVEMVTSELKPLSSRIQRTLRTVDVTAAELKDSAIRIASTQDQNLKELYEKLSRTLSEVDSTLVVVRNHPLMRNDSASANIEEILRGMQKISKELEKGVEIKAKLQLF